PYIPPTKSIMKNRNVKALFTMIGLWLCTTAVGQEKLHRIEIKNFSEMQQYFHYEEGKPVIISGHRGALQPGYPENSIEVMEKTLTYLPAFFEIDPQMTKDSVIVLIHDKTLDRTTNFSGNVSDYTYTQLREARLKDPQG